MDHQEAQPFMTMGASSEELEDLRRSNALLLDAIAARDSFIAVAAHELRNPMTPMIGQLERLLTAVKSQKLSPGQIEQRLEVIQQIMNHYIKRATALLDVSRITAGKLHLEPEQVDLAALVREVTTSFAGAAHYASCALGVAAPPALVGAWDRLAVEQIIDNLLSNAIKYGAGGPVEITADAEGDDIRLQVRDHGSGIAAEDRERIFQRFEQAVHSEHRRSGFGVGLWVVGQLVKAMEGTIKVDDAPGGGSLFTVTLPLHLKKD